MSDKGLNSHYRHYFWLFFALYSVDGRFNCPFSCLYQIDSCMPLNVEIESLLSNTQPSSCFTLGCQAYCVLSAKGNRGSVSVCTAAGIQ